MQLETKRLLLREMTAQDLPALSAILRDEKVMYAYEHAFPTKRCRIGWIRTWNATAQTALASGQWF